MQLLLTVLDKQHYSKHIVCLMVVLIVGMKIPGLPPMYSVESNTGKMSHILVSLSIYKQTPHTSRLVIRHGFVPCPVVVIWNIHVHVYKLESGDLIGLLKAL